MIAQRIAETKTYNLTRTRSGQVVITVYGKRSTPYTSRHSVLPVSLRKA